MKKFKINLMAIIGMMVAIGTVAFTEPQVRNAGAISSHFQFTGTSNTVSQYLDADNWQPSAGSENCELGTLICEVINEDSEITEPEDFVDALSKLTDAEVEAYMTQNTISRRN